MTDDERILVLVDDREAMPRVVDYVGDMIAGRSHIAVYLFHRLPHLPPQLREHGGSEDDEDERELRDALERDVQGWVAEQRRKCRPVLHEARDRLVEAGVSADAVHMKIEQSAFADEEIGDALHYTANKFGCRTIALAHEQAPAIRDLFRERGHYRAGGAPLAAWLIG